MIRITYPIDVDEMTDASVAFLDLKPIARFCIIATNIGAASILMILSLKIMMGQLAAFEFVVIFFCLFWLFLRKKFNRWLLRKRLQSNQFNKKEVEITMSSNGIIWGGLQLKEGNIPWNNIKHCFEIKKGYILPTSATRFLWVPFAGFTSSDAITQFKELLAEKNINITVKYQN